MHAEHARKYKHLHCTESLKHISAVKQNVPFSQLKTFYPSKTFIALFFFGKTMILLGSVGYA